MLNDLEKLTYSTYLCELIDICIQEEESNRELFKDFVSCLYLMNTDAVDYELLVRAFELKVLKATGYGLDLDSCAICKKRINTSNFISFNYYGGICDECEKNRGIYIDKGTYNALKFLNSLPIEKVYRLNLNQSVKSEMDKINSFIIASNYSRKPKSLEMLDIFKGGKKDD